MTDNVFAEFPEIETERLLLREILPEDVDAIFRIFANEEVTRYYDLVTYTDPSQAAELIDFFDESFELERAIRWGIERKEDGALIGTCGFVWLRTYRGEIGYELHPDYWGQGYMREALDAILDFGFSELGLNRIEALVMVENERSARLLRALGFQEEGVLRQHDFFKDQFHDMRLFAILADDYYTVRW
ncbi:MAG TPA: GNAT family protein [Caldilineaceae bacterium]|nr:GNAT family protein [Caldilineaceae bacterium]